MPGDVFSAVDSLAPSHPTLADAARHARDAHDRYDAALSRWQEVRAQLDSGLHRGTLIGRLLDASDAEVRDAAVLLLALEELVEELADELAAREAPCASS